MKEKELTHLSLFTGIGGIDLAAEWAGFETVGQCEFADFPTKVLKKHWPDVPRWRDVKDVTRESFEQWTGLQTVDLISGGFPCQPHSVIGSRKGADDERHLWPEFCRVIRELKPRFVLGENVQGVLSTVYDTVCADLENEGYEVRTFNLPAYAVAAPHERYRVFIVGIAKSEPGLQTDSKANTNGSQRETWSGTLRKFRNYLPGTYWTAHKPPVPGMDDGFPNVMDRYKQQRMTLGNAVVPQQAYPLVKAISEILFDYNRRKQ